MSDHNIKNDTQYVRFHAWVSFNTALVTVQTVMAGCKARVPLGKWKQREMEERQLWDGNEANRQGGWFPLSSI